MPCTPRNLSTNSNLPLSQQCLVARLLLGPSTSSLTPCVALAFISGRLWLESERGTPPAPLTSATHALQFTVAPNLVMSLDLTWSRRGTSSRSFRVSHSDAEDPTGDSSWTSKDPFPSNQESQQCWLQVAPEHQVVRFNRQLHEKHNNPERWKLVRGCFPKYHTGQVLLSKSSDTTTHHVAVSPLDPMKQWSTRCPVTVFSRCSCRCSVVFPLPLT